MAPAASVPPVTVPFPRTVPEDAPSPPRPTLDHRAARVFFEDAKANGRAIGYRISAEGVTLAVAPADAAEDDAGPAETFHPWPDVTAAARRLRGVR